MAQSAKKPDINVVPLETSSSLRSLAYAALKRAITEIDIYGEPEPMRLDERRLSQKLGVSRTPIREALTLLEQEGFVRAVPRRGIYVVRKSKKEIYEMIEVWAALEGMAARLAAARAAEEEIDTLTAFFQKYNDDPASAPMNDYSETNIDFHEAVIKLGGCDLIAEMTGNLFIHMRKLKDVAVKQQNHIAKSMSEHLAIIGAIKARNPDLAEKLVREHTLGMWGNLENSGIFSK